MAEVELHHDGSIATVLLNRPDSHNALTPTMMALLTNIIQQLGQENSVRVVILTGKGRSFCAGADLNSMKAAADQEFSENVADAQAIFDGHARHPYTQALLSAMPTVAKAQRQERIILQGETPNPIDLPRGCRFHPRCPIAQPHCQETEPDWREIEPAHWAACHEA